MTEPPTQLSHPHSAPSHPSKTTTTPFGEAEPGDPALDKNYGFGTAPVGATDESDPLSTLFGATAGAGGDPPFSD
ncbi:hypothetical protein EV193_106317 [Herbihabitans rhizosphaerae]|uniref:Uncharacterized protein n=1 Tax=Herbihabitans rhizosphaerae TaxID=1872711 RepID=A0A4Q7KN74_9PSEU|nr:hypothetical protein EV193_106317 [Herbihabitans rhizosphaerae]